MLWFVEICNLGQLVDFALCFLLASFPLNLEVNDFRILLRTTIV